MSSPLPSVVTTRLEKAAMDNGFDLEMSRQGPWLAFASSQCSLKVWLTHQSTGSLLAAFSQANVARALADLGAPVAEGLPAGAPGGRGVPDIPSLHRLLRRAFQLGKTLPDELLHVFQARTVLLPQTTEAERWVVQRVGQDLFRAGLLEYWEGRCAVTDLAVPDLLRASHIKPWADCETDAERLDIHNGLLLAPHLDAAFDRGYITFGESGELRVSPLLDETARCLLGLDSPGTLRGPSASHQLYLQWHRDRVYLQGDPIDSPHHGQPGSCL